LIVEILPTIQTQTVSAGYGFVDYYDHAHAVAAIQQLNGRNVYGSELKVNWAYASHKEDTSSKLFLFFYFLPFNQRNPK
jgi:RNA recognition motif-containing protein